MRTDDPAGCPAFFAQGVNGVSNGASPEWLAKRLRAIGQKPISALVDITNYITVDLGRPLHVYDKATLSGGLVARKATAGETVLALNGKTYTLDETMTSIADQSHTHDIGGIMGGEDSGVSESTTDVLIECAYFEPERIALDPGIGFGKTHEHNLTLLANCRRFHDLGCPLLLGPSRKGFIGKVLGDKAADRTAGTVGVALALAAQGVQIIRVHDVLPVRQALLLFEASGGLSQSGGMTTGGLRHPARQN